MIKMGKDLPLFFNSNVPQMSGTLDGWTQNLLFNLITKTVVNGESLETTVDVNFAGVWQPLSFKQLMMKPEHQRAWSWWQCHSQVNINLKTDDVIKFRGEQFRVMSMGNYDLYGFYEYHLVKDFTGSGPIVEVTP